MNRKTFSHIIVLLTMLFLAGCAVEESTTPLEQSTAQKDAIATISQYAEADTVTPTVEDYQTAGLNNVNAENIFAINQYIKEHASSKDCDTIEEIDGIVVSVANVESISTASIPEPTTPLEPTTLEPTTPEPTTPEPTTPEPTTPEPTTPETTPPEPITPLEPTPPETEKPTATQSWTIYVYGHDNCGVTSRMRRNLAKNNIPFVYKNIYSGVSTHNEFVTKVFTLKPGATSILLPLVDINVEGKMNLFERPAFDTVQKFIAE